MWIDMSNVKKVECDFCNQVFYTDTSSIHREKIHTIIKESMEITKAKGTCRCKEIKAFAKLMMEVKENDR